MASPSIDTDFAWRIAHALARHTDRPAAAHFTAAQALMANVAPFEASAIATALETAPLPGTFEVADIVRPTGRRVRTAEEIAGTEVQTR